MSLDTKALLATLGQMTAVVLLVFVLCKALVGTWIVGVVVATMIQLFLFNSNIKNWKSILK